MYVDPIAASALSDASGVTAANLPFLLYLIPRKTSVLLLGPPGVGKSEAVQTYARVDAMAMDGGRDFVDYSSLIKDKNRLEEVIKNPSKYYVFVDLRLSEMMPEDLIGIPYRKDGYYDYSPPLWAYILSLPDIAGTLFLDELTNVRNDDLLAAAYKIALEKRVGFLAFDEDRVRVIAAGNPPEFSSIARPLPAPLTNRMMVLRVSPPSIEEWIEYMNSRFGNDWDIRIGAFLLNNEDLLLARDIPAETLENFPTPRAWTDLAVSIYMIRDFEKATGIKLSRKLLEEVVRGKVGATAASALLGFLETELPLIDDVIKNPEIVANLIEEYNRREKGDLRLQTFWKLSGILLAAASRIKGRLREEIDALRKGEQLNERERALLKYFSNFVRELKPVLPILEMYATPSSNGFEKNERFDRGKELMKVFITVLKDALQFVNELMIIKNRTLFSSRDAYRTLYPSDLSDDEVDRLHKFIDAMMKEYISIQVRGRLYRGEM